LVKKLTKPFLEAPPVIEVRAKSPVKRLSLDIDLSESASIKSNEKKKKNRIISKLPSVKLKR